jgi:dipeptidyl aminopeptidase/acylaminoacyl peptidase
MKHLLFTTAICSLALATACSKSGRNNDTGPGGNGFGSGTIYYDWSDVSGNATTYKVNLDNGSKSVAIGYNSNLHSWDVSSDGKLMLQSISTAPADYNSENYVVTNVGNGTIVSQFKKTGTELDNFTSPVLSPDQSQIGVPPTFKGNLLVYNRQGQLQYNIATIGGKRIDGRRISWMPDRTVLCTVGNIIYRFDFAANWGTVVATLNFTSWANITASPDGSKIAFEASSHIWLMNADGSNLKQITTSGHIESNPTFSPDSKNLLIGINSSPIGAALTFRDLAIIPADGQQYNVDDGADKRVINIWVKGEPQAERSNGNMEWR